MGIQSLVFVFYLCNCWITISSLSPCNITINDEICDDACSSGCLENCSVNCTLKYVLENYDFEMCFSERDFRICLYDNQTIPSDGISAPFFNDINLYIEGESETVYISMENSSIIEVFNDYNDSANVSVQWSNIHFVGSTSQFSMKFQDVYSVKFFNTAFTKIHGIELINVSQIFFDDCSFDEMSSSVLSCSNQKQSTNDHWKFLEIHDSFFKNSIFNDELLGNNCVFTNSKLTNNTFRNNIVTDLIHIHADEDEEFERFDFMKNSVEKCDISSFGIVIIRKAPTDSQSGYPTSYINFEENNFTNNIGMDHAMIGLQGYLNSSFTNNTFINNTMSSINITGSCGNHYNLSHNLHSSYFKSNNALNSLVQFYAAADCTKTEYIYVMFVASNLTFEENTFYILVNENIQDPTVMSIGAYKKFPERKIQLFLADLNFINNYGTALTICSSKVTLQGSLNFTHNSGTFGGALLLGDITLDSLEETVDITFTNNSAKYGGAVYILDNPCIETWTETYDHTHKCNINANFLGNRADIEGDSVYSQMPHCSCNKKFCNFSFDHKPGIISGAYSMTLWARDDRSENGTRSVLAAFPGIHVFLNFDVRDCEGTPVVCTAKPLALCGDNHPTSCAHGGHDNGFTFTIDGPIYIVLRTGFINTESNLSFSLNQNSTLKNGSLPKLFFQCRNHRGYEMTTYTGNISVNVSSSKCPIGFKYNSKKSSCECGSLGKNYHCDFVSGKICVERGMWAGFSDLNKNSDSLIVTECNSEFCNYKHKTSCKLRQLTNLVLLSLDSSDDHDLQCVRGHSGVLCCDCLSGKTNSFDSYQCIDDKQCRGWQKWILLILSLGWPTLLGLLILLMIPTFENGVGNFYCSFFALAVLGPISQQADFDPYPSLQTLVNIYTSTFFLGSRALGFIPWCFFKVSRMWTAFYYYVGPVMLFLLLLSLFVSARLRSRIVLKIQSNPIKPISIIFLITFWSLAQTSILLLTPTDLPNVGAVVKIQPSQKYFEYGHIPVFMFSVVILIGLLLFSLLLLLSPFCQGKLTRIMPLLDEFQHCYRNRFRWFAGLYFSSWILLVIIHVTTQTLLFRTLLFALLVIQCICQPYKHVWLNRIDTFLLADLTLLASIKGTQDNAIHEVLTYLTVIVPLLYITFRCFSIIFIRLAAILSHCYIRARMVARQPYARVSRGLNELDVSVTVIQANRDVPMTSVNPESGRFKQPSDPNLEREPLLFSVEPRKDTSMVY